MPVGIPEYKTVQETADIWNVTKRWVTMCIAGGRVPGAVKMGNQWLVPNGAAKPGGARPAAARKTGDDLATGFKSIVEATIAPWPGDNPDAVLDTVEEKRLRLQFEGELAYLRGDFGRVIACFRELGADGAAKLRACALTIAAAVSTGDYPLYTEIETHLKTIAQENAADESLVAFTELCLATASTGAIAPNMAPDWLKNGDFSALPPKTRPDAAYKRAKYFQSLGNFDSMLDVAQTALSICAFEDGLSFHDIYFRVACAIACESLRRGDEAKRWLADALRLARPHGFITPFAESATTFGGLLEQLLEREDPAFLCAISESWKRTFVNWMAFHNQFTRDNITAILPLREYEMAAMVAHRVPRAQIAKQFHISPGRLNNIMKEIYGKLFVSGREELSRLIL